INQPTAISITVTNQTNASCGSSDGSVTVSASGGTPGYSFVWSDGQTDSAATAMSGGSYTVTVTDANGCTQTLTIVINDAGSAVVGIFSSTDVSCNGENNGTATATVSGGTLPYTYSWIPSGGTDSIATGLIAGGYTIQVTDSNGCVSSAGVTINEPAAISITTLTTDVSCNGGSDGIARVTVSGGTPAYNYSWSGGGTDSVKTALISGTYTVTVTDVNSCTALASMTINEPPALVLSMGKTDVSCNGGNDGTAGVTVSGGTLPYTYSWSSGATTANINNLSAGNYTVTVIDANNCNAIDSITVNEPAQLVGTMIDSVNVSCSGGNDGQATVSSIGGTAPYTYSWSTSPIQTDSTATALTAGTHNLTITDANGCQDTVSVLISAPTSLTAIIVDSTNITCNGGSDGTARVTVFGGSSPYTYSWSNGQTDSIATGLSAGIVYTVNVIDNNSCSTSVSITLSQPLILSLSLSATSPLCTGGNDGSVDLTVGGGTTPFVYAWSNSATTEDLSSIPAGTYYVTVTDINACVSNDSVTVNDPSPVLIGSGSTDVSCNGANDGNISVTMSGGTPGYVVYWSTGKVSSFILSGSVDTITSLTVGTYTVSITDVNSCYAVDTIIITEPPTLIFSKDSVATSCNGSSDGIAMVSASGGVSPYGYLWANGSKDSIATGLSAGIIVVTVNDANDCMVIDSVLIAQPFPLNLTINTVDINCNDLSDGTATASVSGGTLPYTLSWSNGSGDTTATGLGAGIHTLTITDANLCISTDTFSISEPALVTILMDSSDVSCNGGSDGQAIAIVSGGVTPYTYSWSTSPIQNSSTATGIQAGNYTITVIDNNNCITLNSMQLSEPALLTLLMDSTAADCDNNNGTASVSASGGITPYTYNWSSGGNTAAETNLVAGTYTVTVTDNNNCKVIGSVTLDSALNVYAGPGNQDFCHNSDLPGYLDTGAVNPKGGVWSAIDAIVSGNLSSDGFLNHLNIPWGIYSIIYSYGGCSDTITIKITGSDIPVDEIIYCASDGLFTLPAASPPGGIWLGIGINNVNTGEVDPSGLGGQTIYYTYTTDNCPDTIMVTFESDLPLPQISCGDVDQSTVTFEWQSVLEADEYQVSYDGINWFTPTSGPLGLEHDTSDVLPNSEVKLFVRYISTSTC
ncbi:SprB repeat-containing protein, partial [Candidatus Amoebophilus asiaticus]|nr:SprB repeat-containing protein [Candidatus Amoebophilus asiaticus]